MIDPLGGIFAFLGLLVKEKVDLWSTKPTQPDTKPIYPEPHRDSSTGISKIFIENSELYDEDVNKYGAWEAQQWVKQGKYNLNEKELELLRSDTIDILWNINIERPATTTFNEKYMLVCRSGVSKAAEHTLATFARNTGTNVDMLKWIEIPIKKRKKSRRLNDLISLI